MPSQTTQFHQAETAQVSPDAEAPVFRADSDHAIHRQLSQLAHLVSSHPVLIKLGSGSISAMAVSWAYGRRKSITASFMPMLIRARKLAIASGRTRLAEAIHANLSDEQGLDPATGIPTGAGSHEDWADQFMNALCALDPTFKTEHRDTALARWDPYPTMATDSLTTLCGMLMATEKCIPLEYAAFLRAFICAYPEFTKPEQQASLHLFADHIEHDERRHLPDLIDGFLGCAPGTRGCKSAIPPSAMESKELLEGMNRVISRRLDFYNHLSDEAMERGFWS